MTGRKAQRFRTWFGVVGPAILLCLALPVGVFADPAEPSPIKSADKKVSTGAKSEKLRDKAAKRRARSSLRLKELPSNERREAKFLRDLGEGFKVAHTKHYTIFYNTNGEDVKTFSMAIEKIYSQVARYVYKLGIELKEPQYKLIAHYFETFEQYRAHAGRIGHGPVQEGKLGFYVPVAHASDTLDPGENMAYFYNIRNTPAFRAAKQQAEALQKQLRDANRGGKLSPARRKAMEDAAKEAIRILNEIANLGGSLTESTLQHEVTHQVLFNVGFHNFGSAWANPRWLAEGMAQLFETPSDGQFWGMALVNKEKLKEFNILKQREMLVPVRAFVSDPRYFFRADAGSLAYPQSWGLLHYISRKYRDELKAYVDLLNARPVDFETTPEKELETFEEAFGPLDEAWEQSWLRWMDNLRA